MKIIYRDPNVTVFQSALFQTNSTVVETDDLILVVDPAWLPNEILQIRQFVEEKKGLRPVWLLFTHSDYDHIIGYGAFEHAGVICSRAMIENPKKGDILEQIHQFDHDFYVDRPYPIKYPDHAEFEVFRDGATFKLGHTKMTFYLTPGHTEDSIACVIWQLGLCLAGDYLCNVEFPFIYFSSFEYEKTLEKFTKIHDKTWFTRLIPGHGDLSLSIHDWMTRRTNGLEYIYEMRESVRTGKPFDVENLWKTYRFGRLQQKYHLKNLELMHRELAEMGEKAFLPKRGGHLLADLEGGN
jgi:hydroxyacylglutathione hydrolase